jgi:hypothetical protein
MPCTWPRPRDAACASILPEPELAFLPLPPGGCCQIVIPARWNPGCMRVRPCVYRLAAMA